MSILWHLANCRLLVMTRDIMPLHAVGIEIVQDSNAKFVSISVIGLRLCGRLFASSRRPKSLATDVALSGAGRPRDNALSIAGRVVDSSTGPVVPPGIPDGNVDEMQGLLGCVQRDSMAALCHAVGFSILTGESAASLIVGVLVRYDPPCDDVICALEFVVGTGAGAAVERWPGCASSAGGWIRGRSGWSRLDRVGALLGSALQLGHGLT